MDIFIVQCKKERFPNRKFFNMELLYVNHNDAQDNAEIINEDQAL